MYVSGCCLVLTFGRSFIQLDHTKSINTSELLDYYRIIPMASKIQWVHLASLYQVQ